MGQGPADVDCEYVQAGTVQGWAISLVQCILTFSFNAEADRFNGPELLIKRGLYKKLREEVESREY